MEKFIVKTSAEARTERIHQKMESSCPECGARGLTTVSTRHKKKGFFSRTKVLKKRRYQCFKCGCEWETSWKEDE